MSVKRECLKLPVPNTFSLTLLHNSTIGNIFSFIHEFDLHELFKVKQLKELIKTYLCYFSQSHTAQCALNLGHVGAQPQKYL